jgi:hypothetical protein
MKAKSAASLLYDYYNPDDQAVVAPSLFTVQAPAGATVEPDIRR